MEISRESRYSKLYMSSPAIRLVDDDDVHANFRKCLSFLCVHVEKNLKFVSENFIYQIKINFSKILNSDFLNFLQSKDMKVVEGICGEKVFPWKENSKTSPKVESWH